MDELPEVCEHCHKISTRDNPVSYSGKFDQNLCAACLNDKTDKELYPGRYKG